MRNGDVKEFIAHTEYEEVAVEYGSYKYFFYGLRRNADTNTYTFTVDRFQLGADGAYIDTVYDGEAPSKKECMEQFFQAPLIDGRSFYEIEKDMTWIEW